jgi:hypothetical protein
MVFEKGVKVKLHDPNRVGYTRVTVVFAKLELLSNQAQKKELILTEFGLFFET